MARPANAAAAASAVASGAWAGASSAAAAASASASGAAGDAAADSVDAGEGCCCGFASPCGVVIFATRSSLSSPLYLPTRNAWFACTHWEYERCPSKSCMWRRSGTCERSLVRSTLVGFLPSSMNSSCSVKMSSKASMVYIDRSFMNDRRSPAVAKKRMVHPGS
eukprot:6525249-Pyramimonas_sp.AAC.1